MTGHEKTVLVKKLATLEVLKQDAIEAKNYEDYAVYKMMMGGIRDQLNIPHPEEPAFHDLVS